jgi:hypothetical protein
LLLTFVLLVWGLLFLMLGVTFAYAQDAGTTTRHQRKAGGLRAAPRHKTTEKKTEIVGIFSAGGDLIVPPQKTERSEHQGALQVP